MAHKALGLVSSCLLLASVVSTGWAANAPSVAQMLTHQPHHDGVVFTTPSAAEQATCKVELVRTGGQGWLLRDGRGQPLRRFYDSTGSGKVNTFAYYLDGVEVYREWGRSFDSKNVCKIEQFRWLNAGGMKWGVDLNEDGKIDAWRMISAEEVSQEILQALITRNLGRLQALWISEAEIRALDLPAAEAARIRTLQRQAPDKFQATIGKLNGLSEKAHWVRLECPPPQCILAEVVGSKQDLVKQLKGSILYELNGQHNWIQTGELIQVGAAWRLIDAPSPSNDSTGDTSDKPSDPELQKMMNELRDLDRTAPKAGEAPGPNADVVRYNLQRAEIVLRIMAKAKTEDRDQWVRQLADCYSAAAQASPDLDRSAYETLMRLEQQIAKDQAGSSLAAYVTFREMSANYAKELAKPGTQLAKVQEEWLQRLMRFVQDYPQAEDAPDALLQLGMGSEFVNKEIEARKWYAQLATNFSSHALAPKAQGALRRLDIEGKMLELAGPMTTGGQFDIASLRGKVVIVYYWASWNQQSVGDFARLKLLLSKNSGKGLELVCINLDNAPPESNGPDHLPGIQLFQPNGLESPLAVQYGVMVLPNMFLVGRDGKVIKGRADIGTLEEEIAKLLK